MRVEGDPVGGLNLNRASSTRIVVGRPGKYVTPLRTETMKNITFNPTCNVPPSIIRNEHLPALERDPGALKRIGLKIGRGLCPTRHNFVFPCVIRRSRSAAIFENGKHFQNGRVATVCRQWHRQISIRLSRNCCNFDTECGRVSLRQARAAQRRSPMSQYQQSNFR